VQFPLRLEGPADAGCPALQQCISYADQRPKRISVDALGGDDHKPPAHLVEFLASEDVGEPLAAVFGMPSAVVLNNQPQVLVRQVVTPAPAAVSTTNDQIDSRLRKPGQHEQQAKPALLR
jgi:hypothetical protein